MSILTRIEYFRYDADAIRAARRAAKQSQDDVAKACGVHLRTVARIEKGIAGSEPTVRQICQHLGIDPDSVITPTEHPGFEVRGRRQKFA